LSRELRRHAIDGQPYDAEAAALSSHSARLAFRPKQKLAEGPDLSVFSQDELDAIAFQLNTRPRKRLGFKPPLEVFMDLIKRTQDTPSGVH